MSYILEALRRADAERERDRGTVPDLHAQQIPRTAAGGAAPPTPVGWWLLLAAAAVLLGLLAWAGWFVFGGKPSELAAVRTAPAQGAEPASASSPTPAPLAMTLPAPPVPAAASAPSAPATPTAAAGTSNMAPAVAISKATSAVASASKPAAAAAAPVRPQPKPLPKPATRAVAAQRPAQGVTAAAPAPSAPRTAASPAEPRVPGLAELPEDIRRQVPAMTMGGSVYSPEPARRMVIVNGQVFVEGSTLAPELTLERINPKSAVFSIRGQRFLVPL